METTKSRANALKSKFRDLTMEESDSIKALNAYPEQMKHFKEVRIVHNCVCDGVQLDRRIEKLEAEVKALKAVLKRDFKGLDRMQNEFDEMFECNMFFNMRCDVASAIMKLLSQETLCFILSSELVTSFPSFILGGKLRGQMAAGLRMIWLNESFTGFVKGSS